MVNLDDYTKEEKTISFVNANLYAILGIIPIALIMGLPFYLIWNDSLTSGSFSLSTEAFARNYLWEGAPVILIALLVGIVVHELIHGITWFAVSGNSWKTIKFGFQLKTFTPYCHCKEPMKIKHYLLGAAMPAIILGIIPAIVAWINGDVALLTFGMFFTLAAGGDFMILYLLRNERMNDYALDHPSAAGCFVFRLKS